MTRKTRAIGYVLLLIATLLFGAFFVGPYVIGSPDLSEYYTFENAPYSGESYIIYKDGSTYYNRNLETGVVSSSSDADTIFQSLIDATTTPIFVKDGTYDFDYHLVVDSTCQLIGESQSGTIFDFTSHPTDGANRIIVNNADNVVLKSFKVVGVGTAYGIKIAGSSGNFTVDDVWIKNSNTGNCLSISGTASDVVVKNSRFDSPDIYGVISDASGKLTVKNNKFNDIGSDAIVVSQQSHVTIVENTIEGWGKNSNGVAIWVRQNGNTSFVTISENTLIWEDASNTLNGILIDSETATTTTQELITVSSNTLKGSANATNGIYLHGHASAPETWNVEGITITGNVINGTRVGISLTTSKMISVSNNIIKFSKMDGINLADAHNCSVIGNKIYNSGIDGTIDHTNGIRVAGDFNIITANTCTDIQTPKTQTCGINLTSVSDENEVYGNMVYGNSAVGIQNDGTNNKIHDNIGFVTENYVSGQNATATTFEIAHGLAGTADYVFCSFNTTAISGYSWTSNSTYITVTVTGTNLPTIMTCYADVRYEP